ncbi:MAG: LysR family transcriptional regulator [Acidobacteriota bacterium]|nr:LysR family transcriptional regulator [Acidobacteriota bacterium]MDQ7087503.1 LysR family transcriptional regulator [Acidobacteriota bacterium]
MISPVRDGVIIASTSPTFPATTVSRKVAELERRLGARLLQRTRRKLSLTDVGQAYYQRAVRAVAEVEEAVAVTRMQQTPRGLLRVTMPVSFGHVGALVASFLERHPEVRVDLVCTDRVVDLVEEGFDVAVRAGRLSDSTLVARRLGVLQNIAATSPAFLDRCCAPRTPEQLEHFGCAVFGAGADRARWTSSDERRTVSVAVRARLVVIDMDFLHAAALAGRAITLLPAARCAADLKHDRLRRVLPAWCSPEVPVHAVYPSRRHLSPKVEAFLDHLSGQINNSGRSVICPSTHDE